MLVEILEELFDLSLQEITEPLDQLGPKSPRAQVFPQSPPQIMDASVNQPAWKARTPLNLDAPLHDLPKYPERVLPNFDPGKGISLEDHLNFFYPTLSLLNFEHEYIVCILIPYTFEPRASSWYFILQANSIAIGIRLRECLEVNSATRKP